MKKIYLKIWQLAKPHYQKGRPYDIPHIEWMMEQSKRIADIEDLDLKLLMPISILHDVGYSKVDQENPDPKSKESKKIHMDEGAKIARDILEKVAYEPELAKKIVRYISIHDNWIFGDDTPYQECKEMAVFNDLDFIYAVSSWKVVSMQAMAMGKNPKDMYDFWLNDEKHTRRPFCCRATKELFEEYMVKLKEKGKQN